MWGLTDIYDFGLFVTSYNEPDYQPYVQPDYKPDCQLDMNRAPGSITPDSQAGKPDDKPDEYWKRRF